MKRITIKDIARELNMHHSTVSRALRNDRTVNEETRKKVNNFAQEKGYQLNMSALQLRGSNRNTLAVLVPNINHTFFSNIISVITNLAFQNGFVVSVFQSNENIQQEREIIHTLIRNNVAGVLASVSMETTQSDHFKMLRNFRIPLVFFDRVCPDMNVSKVTVDNYSALFDVVNLLAVKGCRRIAHITGNKNINVFSERQRGFHDGLIRNGLSYSRSVEIHSAFDIETGIEATCELLGEKPVPDAIICDSHFLTLGAIFKIREMNLDIPRDITLAGFGDNPYLKVTSTKMITVVQPDVDIANAAFELLLKKIDNIEDETVENLTFPAKIIENIEIITNRTPVQ